MRIKYTVTTYKCPHCHNDLKNESDNPLPFMLLIALTAGIALSWFISIAVMKRILGIDYIYKLGSPYSECPNCGKVVKTNEATWWANFNFDDKKQWSFKNKFMVCYVLSGFVPICLLLQFLWKSNFQADHVWAIVFLVIAIICIFIISFIIYKWEKYNTVKR